MTDTPYAIPTRLLVGEKCWPPLYTRYLYYYTFASFVPSNITPILLSCITWLVILQDLVMIFVYNDIRKVPPHSRPPTSYDKWGGGGDHLQKNHGHFWPLLATPAKGRRSLALRHWRFHLIIFPCPGFSKIRKKSSRSGISSG